jgi:hypothetical protein
LLSLDDGHQLGRVLGIDGYLHLMLALVEFPTEREGARSSPSRCLLCLAWETFYNYHRPHVAFAGQERLQ